MKARLFHIFFLGALLIFTRCDMSDTGTLPYVKSDSKDGTSVNTADSGTSETTCNSAAVTIPENTPYWDNSAIKIDGSFINSFAKDYCSRAGVNTDALDFIAGDLPLSTVDGICQNAQTKESMAKYLGNMYLSGYYGGVWLRDELFSNTGGDTSANLVSAIVAMLPDAGKKITQLGGAELIFKALAVATGAEVDLSLKGTSSGVISASLLTVDAFLMIYGYDYGYYYYLLDNPPEGTTSFDSPLSVDSFIDCSMTAVELATLNKYKPVLQDLLHPKYWNIYNGTDVRWTQMNASMNLVGKGSVEIGKGVWDVIMGTFILNDASYSALIDLSARFMLVSELTLLPTMKCYAESDVDAGRCGLLQEASMMTWLIGYAMGLISDLPEGTFPALSCQ